MGYLIQDDFETYTLGGTLPSPWILETAGTSQVNVEADPQAGSARAKVARLFQTSVSNRLSARRTFSTGRTAQAVINCAVRVASPITTNLSIGFCGISTNNVTFGEVLDMSPCIRFSNDSAKLKFWDQSQIVGDGTYIDYAGTPTYTTDAWHTVRIFVDLDQTHLQANGYGTAYVTYDGTSMPNASTVMAKDGSGTPGLVYGFAIYTDGATSATFFMDAVSVTSYKVTHQGIVRGVDGEPLIGATVVAIRQSDGFFLGSTTTDVTGIFTLPTIAPDGVTAELVAFRNPGEKTSARPWIQIF